jgi:hypothetical protein
LISSAAWSMYGGNGRFVSRPEGQSGDRLLMALKTVTLAENKKQII